MGIITDDTVFSHLFLTNEAVVTRPSKQPKKVAAIKQAPEVIEAPMSWAASSALSDSISKLEKNRAKVRRCYHKKINTICTLRLELMRLESQHLDLLQDLVDEENQQQSGREPKMPHVEHSITVRERLLHLSKLKVLLCNENELLRHRIRGQMKHQGRLQQIIDKELDGVVELDTMAQGEPATVTHDSGIVVLRPLTPDESMEIGRASYREIHHFMQQQVTFPSENNALGWVMRHQIQDGLYKYLLRKTFHYCSPREMMEAMWQSMTTPGKFARFFSKTFKVQISLVQEIDENNLMCFRTIARDGAATEFRTLLLQTRFETSNGFMIVGRGLNRDRVQEPPTPSDRGIEWWDMFSWFAMERAGTYGEHCMLTFGGARPESFGDGIEGLLLMLRWESQVLQPLALLP